MFMWSAENDTNFNTDQSKCKENQTKFQTPILARSRYISKFYGQISIVYATISFYGIYFIKIRGLRWHLDPILYSSFSFSKLVKIVQSLLLREFGDLVGVLGQFDPKQRVAQSRSN